MAGLIVIGILFGIFAGTLVALVADERENLPKLPCPHTWHYHK